MDCSEYSWLGGMVSGGTVVDKKVCHRGHNLLHKSPVEVDSIGDIRARRVEPSGGRCGLTDPHRGYCRR